MDPKGQVGTQGLGRRGVKGRGHKTLPAMVGCQGLGTRKGIENYRDRIEIRSKKRDVKAKNCGERVGGQGRGPQDHPTIGWASVVGLDPNGWVGQHGRGLGSIGTG